MNGMKKQKLTAKQAAQAFYDFFFSETEKLGLRDYLDNSFCDEMAEVNLEVDRLNLLYHVENKYSSPLTNTSYRDVFNFVRDYIVHPEDRQIYDDLMNPDHILERLSSSKTPGFRFDHMRYRLSDGRYRYIEQAILAGEQYGFPPNVFRIYIFDIQNVVSRQEGYDYCDSDLVDEAIDENTGLYIQKSFVPQAQGLIDEQESPLTFIALDIEHFKLFDEWYGHEKGDLLLARIGRALSDFVSSNGGLAGYLGSDDYCLIGPYEKSQIDTLYETVHNTTIAFGDFVGFVPVFGIYMTQRHDHIRDAMDRANYAAERAKKDIRNRIHYYDPQLKRKSEEDYRLLLDFMKALRNDEICFFLQPQVRISSRKIVGCEALCRWKKPDGTFVPPGVFIPVLEKFGFICDLDQYLWEKVVQSLSHWMHAGHEAVPCSINISRVDIFTIDVARVLYGLVKKYDVPAQLLKVEITESAYAEDNAVVSTLVRKLRALGFMVFMDDFGSGYSSLNMLGTMKVDAIKLDSMFLRAAAQERTRGMHIIESIVSMAKNLSLPVIVEGVETQSELEFLDSLGCRYVQGYYFYKPMSREDFERVMADASIIDNRGFVAKNNDEFRLREFLDENIYSDAMLNKILGPVGIYLRNGSRVDIVRYNQSFYEAVDVPDFNARLDHIERFVPEADLPRFYALIDHAKENPLSGATDVIRFYKTDGTLTSFLFQMYHLGTVPDGDRFYASARNVTELTDMRDRLSIIAEYVSDSIILLKYRNEKWNFQVVAHGLAEFIGIPYDTLQEELNSGVFWNRINKKERDALLHLARTSLQSRSSFRTTFKMKDVKGKAVSLDLIADLAGAKASNVDYVLTLHRPA